MKFLISFFAAAALSCDSVAADEAAAVARLQSLGGKIVAKDGVATQLTFTDCSQLGAAEFELIGGLRHLKNLTLYGGCKGLNDETLPLLAGLVELETLGTDGLRVSDDGLRHFAAFKNLRSASFFHTSFRLEGFTGAGFAHLRDCPKLERLTVAGMSMGDEGFAAIATIVQLRDLSTWHTYQTERGNAEIAKLPNLRSLKLGQRLPRAGAREPSLSDASVPTVVGMRTLENLALGEAHFTVEALRKLSTLPNLKKLTLYETDLSAEDAAAIRAALPNVAVDWQPLTDEQRKKLEMYLKR